MPKTIAIKPIEPYPTPSPDWKQQLAQAVTSPEQLLDILGLDASNLQALLPAEQQFPVKIPLAYIDKMRPSDPEDPLLLQVLAQPAEMQITPGYTHDPVGDMQANKGPGLLHKYHGRVLLVTTGACAVHCRYCFRRHFPYSEQQAGRDQWRQALDYIQGDPSISEVILSGGDPLVLSDDKLDRLISFLEEIPHLSRLRIHSRLPVVLPDRITSKLIKRLASSRLNVCMVIHANHANEISEPEIKVLKSLQSAGILLLNQAVLLKGINNTAEQQAALSEALYSAGVLPYYLHLLDPVQGAAHFEVEQTEARRLIQEMREKLPGFLVPRLVREIPGELSKTAADEL